MKTRKEVLIVPIETIKLNSFKDDFYSKPENYDTIKHSILNNGILEPLIVNCIDNVIISGNLRYRISIELGIKEVPVIFEKLEDDEDLEFISLSTNHQRRKSSLEIVNEINYFKEHYKIRQGQRTDLDPESENMKDERDNALSGFTQYQLNQYTKLDKLASSIFGKDTPEYKEVYKDLDSKKDTLNKSIKTLEKKFKVKENKKLSIIHYEVVSENCTIYNRSNKEMKEVKDGFVNTIITSPPYFKLRDYNTGEDQLGQEDNVTDYLANLYRTFDECFRVLKDDGSLFVNINDTTAHTNQYQLIPERFALGMLERGWLLNDVIIWVKNNTIFNNYNRTLRNFEYIYHFTKSTKFKYKRDWLEDLKDDDNKISIGSKASITRLISAMDYRDGVLRTNANNPTNLKNLCEKNGIYLTHNAMFPLEVPSICGLLTTDVNDVILDPFNGTSTTGEFCKIFNRKYIGYEVNPEYVLISEIRLKNVA